MQTIYPATEQDLVAALHSASDAHESMHLGGAFSKRRMGGSVEAPKWTITTLALNRVLQYEPRDLTISVEAGVRWSDLAKLLAENRQMIPLDPPYFDQATVGGVIAANTSGSRRRLYGSARDLVIGMRFATLEGKVVQTGGMVVKNVAGLDMAKLLIGSFGTLAAITLINFRLHSFPLEHRTFQLEFKDARAVVAARDKILNSVLQPAAIDVLAAGQTYTLLLEAGGNVAMLDRYEEELGVAGIHDYDWSQVRESTPRFLEANSEGCIARVSSTLDQLGPILESTSHPVVARAGNGVAYLYFPTPVEAVKWADRAEKHVWRYVFEYGLRRDSAAFAGDFAMMGKVKDLFDPQHLLNPGRMYGRI